MPFSTRRTGFALPATLLALIVVGALVTGGVYAAMEHDRTSVNAAVGQDAFMAAERGLEDLLGTRNRIYFQDSVGIVGSVDTIGPVPVTINDVAARYTVFVKRLNTRLFLVESEGEVLGGGRYAGSKRRLSELMRITFTYVPKDRAVTTQTALRLRGQSGIHGMDVIPTDWQDCTSQGEKTGVVAKDVSGIDIKGGGLGGLYGNPPQAENTKLDSMSFIQYGDMVLDDLIQVADVNLPSGTYNGMAPVSSGGICDKSNPMNWGDPVNTAGDCHFYWPIIHSSGDLHLSGGTGQGILIVEGDLELTGNFEFNGLVFVYGSIRSSGVGNKIVGSANILGSSVNINEIGTTGAGSTNLQLSSCAIERAHIYNERFSRPIPLAERKFVDMSGLGVN